MADADRLAVLHADARVDESSAARRAGARPERRHGRDLRGRVAGAGLRQLDGDASARPAGWSGWAACASIPATTAWPFVWRSRPKPRARATGRALPRRARLCLRRRKTRPRRRSHALGQPAGSSARSRSPAWCANARSGWTSGARRSWCTPPSIRTAARRNQTGTHQPEVDHRGADEGRQRPRG